MMIGDKSVKFVVTVCLLLLTTNQVLGICAEDCFFSSELNTWRCHSSDNPFIGGWTQCQATPDSGCIMGGQWCEPLIEARRKVIIDEKMILDVATQQPRLALALLIFRQHGSSYDKWRILSPAVKVSTKDVRSALANAGDSLGIRSSEKATVYDVFWKDDSGARTATLVIDLASRRSTVLNLLASK